VGTPIIRIAMLLFQCDFAAIYTFTLSRTDELAVGGLIAIFAQEKSYAALARYARFLLLGAGLYIGSVIAARGKPLWWGHWTALGVGFSALAAGAAGLLIFALSPERSLLKTALESRVLGTFGKYSYGAYVIHAPLEPLCLKYLPPQRLADMSRSLGHSASQLVGLIGFTVVGIGATMALSVLSFFVYERPFIKLKRYFEYDPAAAARS
jgi:peptidoglycan/LPS O-acetylase OafA/YrhL